MAPATSPNGAEPVRLRTFARSGLTFEVTDGGTADGEPVVLLHGWPGGGETWDEVAPLLADHRHRTLVPDQRGYCAGARPSGVRPYRLGELADDVIALLDAAGLDRAHVVGHDWGGAVAWALARVAPERLATLTVLSTPHPAALARSWRASDQALRSAYVAGLQLPVVPERLLLARHGDAFRSLLRRSGLSADRAARYVERQRQPGALTASLAWYRALRLAGRRPRGDVSVPTLYVWSDGDTALGRHAAEHTGDHVTGPYRFEVLEGVSHWMPEEAPARTAELIAGHVAAHPASGP
ncbi:alpha/beta fold hydrolase [soil metagenome]